MRHPFLCTAMSSDVRNNWHFNSMGNQKTKNIKLDGDTLEFKLFPVTLAWDSSDVLMYEIKLIHGSIRSKTKGVCWLVKRFLWRLLLRVLAHHTSERKWELRKGLQDGRSTSYGNRTSLLLFNPQPGNTLISKYTAWWVCLHAYSRFKHRGIKNKCLLWPWNYIN